MRRSLTVTALAAAVLGLGGGPVHAGEDYDIEVAGDEPVEHRNPWTMVAVTRLPLEVRAA